VLQTLSILIQNIRSETAIFYLFSNNFINELITLRFDFEDDEVLGYFVNMLKAISLKLTQTTVQVRLSAAAAYEFANAKSASPRCACGARHGDSINFPKCCVLSTEQQTAVHGIEGAACLLNCCPQRPLRDSHSIACQRARCRPAPRSSSSRSSRSSSPSRCTRRRPSSSATGTAWCAAAFNRTDTASL